MHTIYRRILLYRPLVLVVKRIKTGKIGKSNNKFGLIYAMTRHPDKVIRIATVFLHFSVESRMNVRDRWEYNQMKLKFPWLTFT